MYHELFHLTARVEVTWETALGFRRATERRLVEQRRAVGAILEAGARAAWAYRSMADMVDLGTWLWLWLVIRKSCDGDESFSTRTRSKG